MDPILCNETHVVFSKLIDIGIPRHICDSQLFTAGGDKSLFLQGLKGWLSKGRSRSELHGFTSPPYNWENEMKKYYPKFKLDDFSMRGEEEPFMKWRNFTLLALRDEILALLSNTSYEYNSGVEISEYKDSPSVSSQPKIWSFSGKPASFIVGKNYRRLQNLQQKFGVLHVFGGHGAGKKYFLSALVHDISASKCPPQVILQVKCKQDETCVEKAMKGLFELLRSKDILFESDCQEVVASKNFAIALVRKLIENGISALLAFEAEACGDNDPGKSDQLLLQSLCEVILNNKEASVSIVITSFTKNYLFSEDVVQNKLLYKVEQLVVFDHQECVSYLQTPCEEASNYSFLAHDKFPEKAKVKDLIEVGTDDVVTYFNGNPLCLKVAKQYCSTYKISYADFLEKVRTSNHEFTQEVAAKNLHDPKDRTSFLHMHNILQMQKKLGFGEEKLQQILRVLALVSYEEIPVLFIGRVCQFLRDSKCEAVKDISLKNQHEASDVVVYMQNKSMTSSVQFTYPDGCITMRQNIHKSFYDPDDTASLGVAINAMLSILSKDNTQRIADMKLHVLHPHIKSLISHAKKVAMAQEEVNEKTSESIGLILSICRLDEIFAHAMTQCRAPGKWRVSLEVLLEAMACIYDIVCYFSASSWLFCGLFGSSASQEDLAFEIGKNAEAAGQKIAMQCIKAGQQCGEYFEKYFQLSVVLNMQNVKDFLFYLTEVKKLSTNDAKSKIQNVIDATTDSIALTPSMIEVLRSNGLMLSRDEMLKSFFSERLTSLMHTLGRLVLYNHDEMSQIELQQCSYYTCLAHYIAKATRMETGIGLMNEYISIANGKVPRLVQDQHNESTIERKTRLDEAYKMARSILNVEGKLHENGVYRQVDGTAYTLLNAYKYMLKVNCKRLKDVPQQERYLVISPDALHECQRVLEIAKNNSRLDMAPQCIVHCGKFYAAMGTFEECFPAFEHGFECKKTRSFGATHLKAWRPDAFAWAVSNLARAMEAYIPLHEANLQEKLHLVIERCKQVLMEDVSEVWKKRMENWIEIFEQEL